MRFKRYQLKKEAVRVVETGHPWIFSSHLSTAAGALKPGDWLQLVDGDNAPIAHGVFDSQGIIAIRIFSRGPEEVSAALLRKRLKKRLERRAQLRNYSNSFRAVHGENDGFPGIVVDVYDKLAVLQTYSPGVDGVGRYVAALVQKELGLTSVLWKTPAKRQMRTTSERRILSGQPPAKIKVTEGKLEFWVEPLSGQKSGAFLDLRGLRKWISQHKLSGARVLNLFSYTGTLSASAEVAGAKEIWSVDISKGALETAKQLHAKDVKKHKFIDADIFTWLEKLAPNEMFDLIVNDPPNMAAERTQVPQALRAYQKLYRLLAPHVKVGGWLAACCCTSRIDRHQFQLAVQQTLGNKFKLEKTLTPEDDHPVGFPEGDYLKLLLFRRTHA